MKRNADAPALLVNLVSEFDAKIGDIRGQSSLVVAAFVEAQPDAVTAPVACPAPAGRSVLRIRVPERARSHLPTAQRKEPAMPADSPDPAVQRLVAGLNRYHLWLVADAVGVVAEYYRPLFAALGYLDPEIWPCSFYGDLRMSEVGTKPLPWFEERAAAFVESRGMVAVADSLALAMPALKGGADAKMPPGVWFRGAELLLKLIVDRHGSVPGATLDEWSRGASMDAGDALRALGVLSCIEVRDKEASLWVIDASRNSDSMLTNRFESLLGKAQECVHAAHIAAMEYFRREVAPPQAQPLSPAQHQTRAQTPQQPAAPPQKVEVPKGKDSSFVPIKLQEPAGRYRAVKGMKP